MQIYPIHRKEFNTAQIHFTFNHPYNKECAARYAGGDDARKNKKEKPYGCENDIYAKMQQMKRDNLLIDTNKKLHSMILLNNAIYEKVKRMEKIVDLMLSAQMENPEFSNNLLDRITHKDSNKDDMFEEDEEQEASELDTIV